MTDETPGTTMPPATNKVSGAVHRLEESDSGNNEFPPGHSSKRQRSGNGNGNPKNNPNHAKHEQLREALQTSPLETTNFMERAIPWQSGHPTRRAPWPLIHWPALSSRGTWGDNHHKPTTHRNSLIRP